MSSNNNTNSTGGSSSGSGRSPHRIYLESQFIYLPDSAQAVLIAGNMLVLIIALCGNITAITIVVKARLSKTTTKLFLGTLAISDLLLVISAVPIELGKLTDKYHSWVFGKFLCETVASVQLHSIMTNAACLFGISFERYLSVIRSPKLSKFSPSWAVKIPYVILILSWILPLGASIPSLWSYEQWSFWVVYWDNNRTLQRLTNDTNYLCQARDSFPWRAEMWTILAIIYFLLLAGLILCYSSIICFVQNRGVGFRCKTNPNSTNKSTTATTTTDNTNITTVDDSTSTSTTTTSAISNSIRPLPSSLSTPPKHQHRRTVRLIMILILISLVLRTPIFIFNLIFNIKKTSKTVANTSAMYFLHLLANISTAVSPFLYAIWNNSLRSSSLSNPSSKDGHGHQNVITKRKHSCCCCLKSGRTDSSKTLFTNGTSSATNIFKFRQNSFTFNSQSKIYPSSNFTTTNPVQRITNNNNNNTTTTAWTNAIE